MADPTNPNEPTATNADSGSNAQQALDDLTVLQNVQNQNMGDSRLNVARPVDVSDTSLGNLANVQQGSTSAPQVHDVGGITTGVNVALDVAIESNQTGSAPPPTIDSTPVTVVDEAVHTTVAAQGGTPLNVQALPDLALPDSNFKPQDVTVGPAGLAPPVVGTAGYTAPAAAAAAAAPLTDAGTITLDQGHVNHAPTMAGEVSNAGDEHAPVKGQVHAADADGDAVTYHLSGDNVVVNTDGTETLATDHGSVTLNTATGEYAYTPPAGDHLGVDESVGDSFQVTATDTFGATSNVETVKLTITGTNDAPTVTTHDDLVTANDHTAISGSVKSADVDTGVVDGVAATNADGTVGAVADTVHYALVDATGAHVTSLTTDHGTVTIDPQTGEYSFTPVGDAGLGVGEKVGDHFSVVAIDNHGAASDPTQVNVTITGSNDGPVIDLAHTDTSINVTDQVGGAGHVAATDADTGVVHDALTGANVTIGPADTLTYSFGTGDDGKPILSVDTPHGTATVDPTNGNYSFAPNDAAKALPEGTSTTDHFSVVVSDGQGGTAAQTIDVNVSITGTTNHDPVIDLTNSTDATASDHAGLTTGHVAASDIDPGQTLTYSFGTNDDGSLITTLATDHGTVNLNSATGEYSFTPNAAAVGLGEGAQATDSFTVTVSDGHGGSSAAHGAVDITGTNDAPTITSAGSVHVDQQATVTGTIHATDPDSDAVTYHLVDAGGHAVDTITNDHGTVSIDSATGKYTFVASDETQALGVGQSVTDQFQVQATDSHGATSAVQSFNVTVDGLNDGPTVTAGPLTTSDDHSVAHGSIAGSDIDAGDSVTFHLAGTGVSSANGVESLTTDHGVVELNTATGAYTFTPAGESALGVGATASDSFGVFTTDSHNASSPTASVGVTITGSNDAPTVTAGPLVTSDDHTAVTGHAAGADVDAGDTVSYSLVDSTGAHVTSLDTAHGHVSIDTATGDYTFTPSGDTSLGVGQTLGDSFKVVSTDNHGATSAPSTVGVTITGSNDAPTVTVSNITTANDHTAVTGRHAVGADVDTGDTMTYHVVGGVSDGSGHETLTTDHGTVKINTANGEYSFTPSGDSSLGVGQTLGDSFKVVATDNHGANSAPSTVSVTITGSNDAPTVTVNNITTADDHTAVTGHSAGADVDVGDTVSYHVVGGVADGSGHELLTTAHGAVSINTATGDYTFTPSGDTSLGVGQTLGDSFQVVATDNHGASSAPSTVAVSITGSNDGPTVSVAGITTADDHTAVTGHATGADVDTGDTVSYHVVGGVADGHGHETLTTDHGAVSINTATGDYTFTPANDSSLGVGAKLNDSFQVVATDNHGASSAPSTVAVTITGSNDAPVVSATQTISGTESTSSAATVVTGHVSATDVDAGDTLSYSMVADSATHHGAMTVDAGGNLTFTAADNNWSGSDSFTVKVSDGHGGTANETVNVNVGGAADQASVSVQIGAGTVTPNGSFTVQNLDGEAGYSNTYGYYVTDANGNPTTGQIVFANTHAEDNVIKTVTGVDPDHVGFFIIPNGHSDNPNLTDGTNITFTHDSSGWHAVANGQVLSGDGAGVLFDKASLNTDGLGHTRDASVDTGNQNWEDLAGGGDRDFNDVNATVTWQAAAPTATHPLTVTAAFPDMDGSEKHTVSLSNLPAGSTLYQDGVALTAVNGVYSIDPTHLTGLSVKTAAGFAGDINVTVTAVSSENGTTATATATATTVHDDLTNHGPSAAASVSYSDNINTALSGAIAATDADGNHLSYALATGTDGAQHGSVVLGIDGSFTYTPTTGFTGADHFNVVVSDGHGGTTTETIAVNVAAPNHAPVIDASHTTASLTLNSTHSADMGQVTATDADGDHLTYSVLSDNSTHHGSLTVDSSSGSFFYDSTDTNWKGGADTFTVQVSDGHGGTANQSVTVNVSGAGNDVGYTATGHSGGGAAQPVGWGNGGGRTETWGTDGSWTVGGENSGNDHHTITTNASTDSHWGSGWYAWDSGNPGQAGTGDTFSIAGYNQHNGVISGDNHDTLLGSSGNDYISLDNGYGQQMIKGISHIQLGDGNAVLDMTTPNMDYGNMTVAGGSGSDVMWTAGGNDLITAGSGTTTVHAGAGDDTVVAGAGNDTLLGQDGNDTFLFDFGHGHDTVDGGAGTNWTDTIDLSTNMHAGATITITTADNHSWTVASDGDHQAHATIQLGQDKGGDITIHSNQGDETIHFTNIEAIKY